MVPSVFLRSLWAEGKRRGRGILARAIVGNVPVQRDSKSASAADGWNSSQGQDSGFAGSEVPEGPERRLKSPGRRYNSEQLGLHVLAGAEGQETGRERMGDLIELFCLTIGLENTQHRNPSPKQLI